jgi:CBS domain containing-hemolysin-like protein
MTQGDVETPVRYGVIAVYGLATLGCVALSAFCSGTETAFLSANRAQIHALAEQGNNVALSLTELYVQPERTQAAILVSNNAVNVAATTFSLMFLESVATDLRPEWRDLANTLLITPLLIVFGEVLPKSFARSHADRFLTRSGRALAVLDWALRPIGVAVLAFTTALMRVTGQSGKPQIVTREDLRALAELGETQGVIHQEQRRMIHAVLELEGQRVAQVMRPLADIVSVAEGISVDAFLELVQESGYSRIPVYRDRINDIVGVVHVLDVIYADGVAETIDPFVRRELFYVPETKRVTTLLAELRFRRNPMAFVVDEYGGIVGLVTVEDLVEEIVGEIRDERDAESTSFRRDELTRTLECDGKLEIDALNQELEAWDTEIERGDYETIAGFIIHALDRVPRPNDVVETDDLLCIVVAADQKSVQRVRIIRKRGASRRR